MWMMNKAIIAIRNMNARSKRIGQHVSYAGMFCIVKNMNRHTAQFSWQSNKCSAYCQYYIWSIVTDDSD